MKCKVSRCNASCCYNIAFKNDELVRFADRIVNPVIDIVWFGGIRMVITSAKLDKNKCPFLRADYRCNIYENRPDVCRKFGEIDKLSCKFLKK